MSVLYDFRELLVLSNFSFHLDIALVQDSVVDRVGMRRVQSTTPSGVGSPEATPSVKGRLCGQESAAAVFV